MPIPSSPALLTNVLGYAADLNSIPATTPTGSGAFSYQTGFPAITGFPLTAGGIAPSRQDFNGVFNLIGQHLFFLQSGSIYPWSATLDYLTGAHVLGSDGNEYIAQKSNGPDVSDSSAVNPVGDDSGTWLSAVDVYTATIQAEVLTLNKDWIGVPRPWRSTTLPPNYCWANGDFVAFADWPELKAVYEAGGFAGLLMAWDADGETQAANLGQWRPDAAQPTGLYTPNLTGQFLRCWGPGAEEDAGAWHRDEIRNITGDLGSALCRTGVSVADKAPTGAFNKPTSGYRVTLANTTSLGVDGIDASLVVPTGAQNVPQHIWQPVIIYLGQPAAN